MFADGPRAPKLGPASNPIFDSEMPDFELPEACAEDDEIFEMSPGKGEDEVILEFYLDDGSDLEDLMDDDGNSSFVRLRGCSDASTVLGEDWVSPKTRTESRQSSCLKEPPPWSLMSFGPAAKNVKMDATECLSMIGGIPSITAQ
jgi:hypothetical protein